MEVTYNSTHGMVVAELDESPDTQDTARHWGEVGCNPDTWIVVAEEEVDTHTN